MKGNRILRIAVCFNESCYDKLISLDDVSLLYISDITPRLHIKGKVINPIYTEIERELSISIRDWFLTLSNDANEDLLLGYANNFFECSIAPIAGYLYTLDKLIKENPPHSVEVWLATKYINSAGSLCYYMAEHESQGRRLYSRNIVFSHYIRAYCSANDITLRNKHINFAPHQYIYNELRIWSVFVYRFFRDVRAAVPFKNEVTDSSEIDKRTELVVASRTTSQTESIAGFIIACKINALIIAGSSFLDEGRNSTFSKSLASKCSSIKYLSIQNSSVRSVIRSYWNSFLRIIFYKPPKLKLCGCVIDANQATKEVFVMLPELICYRDRLSKALSQKCLTDRKQFVTLEQKSPHAFADAQVARKYNFTCIQVMQCDQHPRYLPYPVVGDYFLTDTQRMADDLIRLMPSLSRKIKYIGSFKSLTFPSRGHRYSLRNKVKPVLCYFTHSDDIDSNKEVISVLISASRTLDYKLVIKLHPRDRPTNYAKFKDVDIISDHDTVKSELFSSLDLAVTAPSGVVNELIHANVPFLLCGFFPGMNPNSYGYWSNEYIGCLTSINSLDPALGIFNLETLLGKYQEYRVDYFRSSGILVDRSKILSSFRLLHSDNLINTHISSS